MTGPEARPLIARAEAFARPFYAAPQRAYHDAGHVLEVLDALASRDVLTRALSLAAWGHDLIYDPRADNNEARSAATFGAWLATQGQAQA